MTKREFIRIYCKESEITWKELKKEVACLPCKCSEEGCNGWAMVHNNKESIDMHNYLYNR
jgi:hypothetical protein